MNGRRAARVTGVSGIGAVLSYSAATLLGGRLHPGYAHRSQAISELTAAGAPRRGLLACLYLTYNLLLGLFTAGAYLSAERTRLARIGWGLQLVNVLSGLLQVTTLRMDPIGTPLTKRGIGHFVAAGLSSLCTVVGTVIVGLAGRQEPKWRPLASFSVVSGIGITATGLVAAQSAARRSRVLGLWERGTIGLYLLWVLVLSVHALLRRPGGNGPKLSP